ncbi:hypothetical protein QFC19_004035 [Naganishia cerealis]|uniref:Uncharacterized protein n=1 Tax=Naganishia cerealis TaxID=610337 RepID=A0ACC2VYE4_9TREE|nr:hypothetical protein QFC19_004035 [Naganishia cerealis]
MRFKVSTHPPLTAAKAWLPLPPPIVNVDHPVSASESSQTVLDLKQCLSTSFPTVKAYGARKEEIVLEVDGFELLDDSRLVDLGLTATDIIDVKIKQGVVRAGKKRKTEKDPSEDVWYEQSAKRRKTLAGAAYQVLDTLSTRKDKKHEHDKKRKQGEKALSLIEKKEKERKKDKKQKKKRRGEELEASDRTSSHLQQYALASLSKSATSSKSVPSVPLLTAKTPTAHVTTAPPLSDLVKFSAKASTSKPPPVAQSVSRRKLDLSVQAVDSDSHSDAESRSELQSTSVHNAPQTAGKTSTSEKFPVLLEPKQTNKPPVPPGQGSAKTRERNLRRKLLRQAARQTSQLPQQQTGSSPSNSASPSRLEIPAALTTTTSDVIQLLPIPKSTANRNKSKTYMKGMEGLSGKRTVFGQQNESEGEGDGYAADVSMSMPKETATPSKLVGNSTVPPLRTSTPTGNTSANATPQKAINLASNLTFATPISSRKTEAPTTSRPASARSALGKSQRPHSSTRPKFTAPSSLDTLPANMFVTSMFFPWPHGKKQGKSKDLQRAAGTEGQAQQETFDASVVGASCIEEADSTAVDPAAQEFSASSPVSKTAPTSSTHAAVSKSLHQTEREKKRRAYLLGREYIPPATTEGDDFAEEELVDAQMSGLGSQVPEKAATRIADIEVDWLRAETAWDELSVITMEELSQLREGSLLAWKALEMDFATFTPEIKVKLGEVKVVKTSPADDSTDRLYQVHVLRRPDAEDQEGEVEENLAVDTANMTAGEYRLLR